MAYLAVDKDGKEWIFEEKPYRVPKENIWYSNNGSIRPLKIGRIKEILGYKLSWEDEPIEWN